ncbi:heterokaryon incompatibility [Penicillium sp. IBT 35674x]|nr:heterokaryon incompatibility [Penicillium sp. IBT 35674x]
MVEQFIENGAEQPRRQFRTNAMPDTFETVRRIGGFVDWNLLSGWLSTCSEKHADCGPRNLGIMPAHFRLIDVQRRCIIYAPQDCRYVALSYVWGPRPNKTDEMTSRETLESLQKVGGLLASNVAKTINDAITICAQLKENYLWVDQYCIVQDDPNDQAAQIASMAAIYSSAAFVIISTDGDMHDGIPGVSSERVQKQIQCQILGIDFINKIPSGREISGGASVWSTRGWTYQEGILGRRKLYFSSSQSFFECDDSVLDEDGMKQEALYSSNGLHPQKWQPLVDSFYSHVGRYSRRHLGSQFDIYNAIEGVASALYGKKHPLWFGLPRDDFDKALLWCPDSNHMNHTSESLALKDSPGGLIPSWSWSSTRWDLLLLDDCNRRPIQYCGSLVVWHSCQQTENFIQVESIDPYSAPDFQCSLCENGNEPTRITQHGRYKDEQLLSIAIAWGQGCIESDYPFKLLRKTSLSSFKEAIASKWPCMHTSWQFQGLKNRPSSESLSYIASLQPKLEPTAIFTRAQSAFFRLNLPTDQEFLLRDYPIIDDDGTVGVLVGQDPELQAELLSQVEAGDYFEFIALSVSTYNGIILPDATTSSGNFEYRDPKQHLRENEVLRELAYLDKKGTPLLPIPVVNVMLIRRTGSSARRVGIAWIYLKKWVKARPQFGDVFLQ